MSQDNMLIPYIMEIEKITEEAPSVKTFKLKFANPEDEEKISISYDKKTNQIKVMSSKQRNYIINVTEVK